MAYASSLLPLLLLLSNSKTTSLAGAPSAGAASAAAAFTATACATSLMALVYVATQAFKASFSNTSYGVDSLPAAPTSELPNIPLLRDPY